MTKSISQRRNALMARSLSKAVVPANQSRKLSAMETLELDLKRINTVGKIVKTAGNHAWQLMDPKLEVHTCKQTTNEQTNEQTNQTTTQTNQDYPNASGDFIGVHRATKKSNNISDAKVNATARTCDIGIDAWQDSQPGGLMPWTKFR